MKKTRHQSKKTNNQLPLLNIIAMGLLVIAFLTVVYFWGSNYFSADDYHYDKQDYPHLNQYEVHGIDVSKHNGKLNWDAINQHSINDWELKFVFVRATVALADGSLVKDKKFDENWRNALSHDLIRGAYHFYSSAVDVNEQVDLFKAEVYLQKGDLPPVLDVENFERGKIYITSKDIPKIEKWLLAMEKNYGVKPIIYTSKKMFLDYFKKPKFKNYHFWIANYGDKISDLEKHEWTFWQHCEDAKINSHGCSFDLNVFNGDENQLQKICIQ
jgi:lysozyme